MASNKKMHSCNFCCYVTHLKSNFQRHIESQKHMKRVAQLGGSTTSLSLHVDESHDMYDDDNDNDSYPTIDDDIDSSKYVLNNGKYWCTYCNKPFSYRSNLSRHIKYNCKKNKDEDFKELARLLNEQLKCKDHQLLNQQKLIDKLTRKLQIKNINNGTINNHTQIFNNNMQLLNHASTDYSHLTDNDYIHCIKNVNHCVKTFIEKVHFNPMKPENMNIYISSIKGPYIMVYENNKWQIRDRSFQMDKLYSKNECQIENWFDECKEKYPKMVKSFERYLKNKEDNEIFNDIKREVLMLLYNKKDMVVNNKEIEYEIPNELL